MQYLKELRLELSGCGCPRRIFAKQLDRGSRFLKIQLMKDGLPCPLPEGAVVRISAKKPDGNFVLNDCSVENEWIFAELTEQMLAVPGEVRAEIQLYEGEALLTSASFSICVRSSVISGDALESTYECSALLHALETIDNSVQAADTALEKAVQAQSKTDYLDQLLPECEEKTAQAASAAAACEAFLQQDVPAMVNDRLEALYGQPGGIPQLDENGQLPLPTAAEIGAAEEDHTHQTATASQAGFLSAADKQKLDGIEAGAVNVADSGWKLLPVAESFTPYLTSTAPKYRSFGPVIYFTGEVRPASASIAINSASSVVVGVLPEGYRPVQRIRQICHGSGNNKFMLSVEANGSVYINRYGTTSGYASSITGNEWLPFNITYMTA